VGLFRRREPLHERLAREGGLAPRRDVPAFTGAIAESGIHGIPRERGWDAVVTVDAELDGREARFVGLADELVVEEGEGDLLPLAEAVERELDPPYRAEAVRRSGTTWVVGARRIRVVELPDLEGGELLLTMRDGGRDLRVDGERRLGAVPVLEGLGSGDFVVRGERVAGDVWEIKVDPL